MKIDHDLRQAIKAAHKHQPGLTYERQAQIEAAAVEVFLKARPALKQKARTLLKRKVKVAKENAALREQLDALLDPVGLTYSSDTGKISIPSFRHSNTFVAAGGDLSEIEKCSWEVDQVIAELASADPKHQTKILAKYGIRWE